MERQTAYILESVFGGIAFLFALLWIFLKLIPLLDTEPDFAIFCASLFLNPYFFLFVAFAIPSGIFNELKKQAEKQQKLINQQQQQQQQLITVNVPPQMTQPKSDFLIPSIPPTDFIYCIHCGSQNLRVAKFCKVCGATIE